MAKGKKKQESAEQELPIISCSDCRWFVRDTEGISRNAYTGEYFMGICSKNLHPDSPRKQFANKPRQCKHFKQ